VIDVERSKSHGHAPALGLEREIREFTHGLLRLRSTNQ
jgi:hypothetical protein